MNLLALILTVETRAYFCYVIHISDLALYACFTNSSGFAHKVMKIMFYVFIL